MDEVVRLTDKYKITEHIQIKIDRLRITSCRFAKKRNQRSIKIIVTR